MSKLIRTLDSNYRRMDSVSPNIFNQNDHYKKLGEFIASLKVKENGVRRNYYVAKLVAQEMSKFREDKIELERNNKQLVSQSDPSQALLSAIAEKKSVYSELIDSIIEYNDLVDKVITYYNDNKAIWGPIGFLNRENLPSKIDMENIELL